MINIGVPYRIRPKPWTRWRLDVILRFLLGGAIVSAFAALGSVVMPTSFAGLFGAAPSVPLATLGLGIAKDGRLYASTECRPMLAGAVA